MTLFLVMTSLNRQQYISNSYSDNFYWLKYDKDEGTVNTIGRYQQAYALSVFMFGVSIKNYQKILGLLV